MRAQIKYFMFLYPFSSFQTVLLSGLLKFSVCFIAFSSAEIVLIYIIRVATGSETSFNKKADHPDSLHLADLSWNIKIFFSFCFRYNLLHKIITRKLL